MEKPISVRLPRRVTRLAVMPVHLDRLTGSVSLPPSDGTCRVTSTIAVKSFPLTTRGTACLQFVL